MNTTYLWIETAKILFPRVYCRKRSRQSRCDISAPTKERRTKASNIKGHSTKGRKIKGAGQSAQSKSATTLTFKIKC